MHLQQSVNIFESAIPLLYRRTSVDAVSDNMTSEEVPTSVYHFMDRTFREVFLKEYEDSLVLDIALINDLCSILQCNAFSFRQGYE